MGQVNQESPGLYIIRLCDHLQEVLLLSVVT
jgi:hypothetical protein